MNWFLFDLPAVLQLCLLQSTPPWIHFPAKSKLKQQHFFGSTEGQGFSSWGLKGDE